MKAIKVEVQNNECFKIAGFIEFINDEGTFAYQTGSTEFIVVTTDRCNMATAQACIVCRFSEEIEITNIR